jgi:dihydroorotate dehydrogenase electron transfer subunit
MTLSDPAPVPTVVGSWVVPIRDHVAIARDTYRIRLDAPELAAAIRPGQFVMVRPVPGASDPLLGRPFALYDVVRDAHGHPVAVDIVYLVIGRGTSALAARRPGDTVAVWGPLGNGFGAPPASREDGPIVFVAGGIGQTPFLALARWWRDGLEYGGVQHPIATPRHSVSLLYGARSADLLAGVEDFRAAGVDVEIATDDGSIGHHGFVTDLLQQRLERGERPAKVIGCGPPPMLAAFQRVLQPHDIPCDLSLENHMACGFGACYSCVAPIRQKDGSTDLKRVCVEGPIFDAATVVLD